MVRPTMQAAAVRGHPQGLQLAGALPLLRQPCMRTASSTREATPCLDLMYIPVRQPPQGLHPPLAMPMHSHNGIRSPPPQRTPVRNQRQQQTIRPALGLMLPQLILKGAAPTHGLSCMGQVEASLSSI